ncbi:radical SAM protein [Sphingosinicellaceae bacterium]|nr:radical SAM protein [Sphingosinicellaceae bacterium]
MNVLSFGCRLNIAESAMLARLSSDPELVIVNSCAVTSEAVRQSAQAARRAGRSGKRVVVTGCAAEVEAGAFAGFRTVGRLGKFEARSYLAPLPVQGGAGGGCEPLGEPSDRPAQATEAGGTHPRPLPEGGRGAIHTRAFVPVQTGCDHACTFCIIARARGPSVSTPLADVVDGIARLVDAGCNEVILTGVDLTSYAANGETLGTLVQAILSRTALPRLRLSSIDSIEADPALLDTVASEPRLMPQLHLSLQSGDDLILKRMRRRHGRDHAIRFCADLRARRPGIAFAADLITGFPTETEAMFENTLALVDACGLTALHVFPYSRRPGTPAARMPQVAPGVARERAARLRALGESRTAAALTAAVGQPQRILVERSGTRGRTEAYLPARVPPARPGSIVTVTATAVVDGILECA